MTCKSYDKINMKKKNGRRFGSLRGTWKEDFLFCYFFWRINKIIVVGVFVVNTYFIMGGNYRNVHQIS